MPHHMLTIGISMVSLGFSAFLAPFIYITITQRKTDRRSISKPPMQQRGDHCSTLMREGRFSTSYLKDLLP